MSNEDSNHELFEKEDMITLRLIRNLTERYNYLPSQIRSEVKLQKDKQFRADIIVYTDEKKAEPFIVIEVKSKSKAIDTSTIYDYLAIVRGSNAKYFMLTNGLECVCFKLLSGAALEIPDIPKKDESFVITRNQLKPLYAFDYSLWNLSNLIRTSVANNEQVKELNKLILCKILDEKSSDEVRFSVQFHKEDNSEAVDVESTFESIVSLFEEVKRLYPGLFPSSEKIRLPPNILYLAVAQLQSYGLNKTEPKMLIKFYDSFLNKSTLGRAMLSFVPQEIVNFMVNETDPAANERVLDPYCGAGAFVLGILQKIRADLTIDPKDIYYNIFKEINESFAYSDLFAFDLNPEMVSATKIKLLLFGISSNNVFEGMPSSELLTQQGSLKDGFDVVIGKVPMGFFLPLTDSGYSKTLKRQPVESYYIQECLKLLKESGRMALVVPENVLFSSRMSTMRQSILNNNYLRAIISLPIGAFLQYGISIKMNILLLEKAKNPESSKNLVFMADLNDPVFKAKGLNESLDQVSANYVEFKEKNGTALFSNQAIFSIKCEILKSNWSVSHYKPVVENVLSIESPIFEISGDKTQSKNVNVQYLQQIAEIRSGESLSAKNYLPKNHENTIPYLRIGDMQNETISLTNLVYATIKESREDERGVAYPGEILLSVKGTIGKLAIVPKDFKKVYVSPQIAILRLKAPINLEYLLRILKSTYVQKQLESLTTGAFIPYLSVNDLKKIIIPLPSLNRQKKVAEQILKLKDKERQLDVERIRLEQEKNRIRSEIEKLLLGESQ